MAGCRRTRCSKHVHRKWEVLPGIRLLGTTCCCRLSNHQAAAAQMHLVEKHVVRVPTPLKSTSPFSECRHT